MLQLSRNRPLHRTQPLPSRNSIQNPDVKASEQREPATDAMEPWAGPLRDWLLLLLRFAITRLPADEATVLARADELDRVGQCHSCFVPTFFHRTTVDVCEAIRVDGMPGRDGILKRLFARIDNPHLKRAFEAAVGLDHKPRGGASRLRRQTLWSGLRP